ncbi:MAG: hypothetical protein D6732_27045 [Methanobacteriota archaeon]|nr:MAG: hypothetical protein D6732_27045 [Euryarchaeota archaeon]
MRPRLVIFFNELFGSQIFDWIIPTPNQMYAIAFLVFAVVFYSRGKNAGFSPHVLLMGLVFGGAGAFLGAKVFYILLHLESYLIRPEHIFAAGGSVSFGAYLGGMLSVMLYLRYIQTPVMPFLDFSVTILPLATALGRWSCFLNGDDFGKLTNRFWGVCYPRGSYPFSEQVARGVLSYQEHLSLPVHPNQLYLSLNALVLFFLMGWIYRHTRDRPGITFLLYGLLYGSSRFLLEFFREGSPILPTTLIFPQVICLGIVLVCAVFFVYITRTKSPLNQSQFTITERSCHE